MKSGKHHAVDSGLQLVLVSGISLSGTWISFISGIPDSKARHPGFNKQTFLGFRNP